MWCCTGTKKLLVGTRRGAGSSAGPWVQSVYCLIATKKLPSPHPPSPLCTPPSFGWVAAITPHISQVPVLVFQLYQFLICDSSPKQPWKGGGRGSNLRPLTRTFHKLGTVHPIPPLCLRAHCAWPWSSVRGVLRAQQAGLTAQLSSLTDIALRRIPVTPPPSHRLREGKTHRCQIVSSGSQWQDSVHNEPGPPPSSGQVLPRPLR